jgi:hypothetical protein
MLEVRETHYDGRTLSARFLVSAVGDSLRLDKRFIASVAFSLKDVSGCATGHALDFMVVDVLASAPQEEDILVLQPGYWFGRDLRIPLFDEHLLQTQSSPECVDVEIAFHALGGEIAARERIRVSLRTQSVSDAGTSTDEGTQC